METHINFFRVIMNSFCSGDVCYPRLCMPGMLSQSSTASQVSARKTWLEGGLV
jgi:hypothetical protein